MAWGRGVRVGEADNPGPSRVVVANVTSIKGAWQKVASLGAELLVLQEVRCTLKELEEIAVKAKAQVVCGREVDGKVLVAALAWAGELQHVAGCPSGQSHHFKWRLGKRSIDVRNGYYQGGTREEKDLLENVLGEWLEAAELAGEPALVCGDFNATRDELDITRWYDAAGWYELGGEEQPPTCLPGRGQPRRLDWLWANAAAKPALCGNAEVRWDVGISPHAVQSFSIELGRQQPYRSWRNATPLQTCEVKAEVAEYFGDLVWQARHSQWEQCRKGNLEAEWDCFWQTTLELHNLASGGLQEDGRPGAAKMQAELKPQKCCCTVDRTEQLLVKRVGQLKTLQQIFGDTSLAKQHIRNQVKKKLRTNVRCELVPPLRGNLNDPFFVKANLQKTKDELERYRVMRAARRQDGWHTWVADQKADSNKKVYAWVRRDEAAWAPCPLGKQEQLDEAEVAWWRLWRREPLSAQQVAAALEQIERETPMGPLGRITGAQLRKAAKKMGKKKAAGADGLAAHDWAWWPAVHWDRLALLVQRCESEGRWPEQLRLAHVALLSKGGKPVRGLQARPITILPLVYRAWAKIRARQLRVWLEGHTEMLVGSRQEAEFQAAILAATLSLGKATGAGAGAACLDWSKAYDTVDLNLLEQAVLKAP